MTPVQIIGLTFLAFALGGIVTWGFGNFLAAVWNVAHEEERGEA